MGMHGHAEGQPVRPLPAHTRLPTPACPHLLAHTCELSCMGKYSLRVLRAAAFRDAMRRAVANMSVNDPPGAPVPPLLDEGTAVEYCTTDAEEYLPDGQAGRWALMGGWAWLEDCTTGRRSRTLAELRARQVDAEGHQPGRAPGVRVLMGAYGIGAWAHGRTGLTA
eukprot:363333-Chlamydomonas_euryale.AAC.7